MEYSAFDRLLGQPQVIKLLSQAIAQDRVAPGYLFVGPSGIGKRLAAECFIQLLLRSRSAKHPAGEALKVRVQHRNHPDLLWVEPTYTHQGKRLSIAEAEEKGLKRRAPPVLRLEQIREIAEFLSRPPLEAAQSVVVLDRAETMAEAAANALLKTLEEPGRASLILIAPSVDALLPTLISRCQVIPFRRLDQGAIAQILQQTGQGHILEHPQILSLAQGSPGEAIASWQQFQAIEEKAPDLLRNLQQPPTSVRQALTLGQTIAKTLDTETQLWLVGYLQQCYWQRCWQQGHVGANRNQAAIAIEILETARQHLRRYVQPRLVWEVSMMKLVSG